MNTLFDVLRHLVEQAGGWASDEAKAAAHKIISDHEQQAAALVGDAVNELGKLTDPTQPPAAPPASPSPETGTLSDASSSTEAPA